MKRQYIHPCAMVIQLAHEHLMKAVSIQNATGDIQKNVEENDDEDFEAGAKRGSWNANTGGSSRWDD